MRIIISFLAVILVILQLDSCKKKGSDLSSTSSQLWLKVGNDVPDFSIGFNGQDAKNKFTNYSVTYINNEFIPNLRTIVDNPTNETWVMVHKSFDKTNEIILQLAGETKLFKAKGFAFGEKRFIEISYTLIDGINVNDRDITTINQIIWIE